MDKLKLMPDFWESPSKHELKDKVNEIVCKINEIIEDRGQSKAEPEDLLVEFIKENVSVDSNGHWTYIDHVGVFTGDVMRFLKQPPGTYTNIKEYLSDFRYWGDGECDEELAKYIREYPTIKESL